MRLLSLELLYEIALLSLGDQPQFHVVDEAVNHLLVHLAAEESLLPDGH